MESNLLLEQYSWYKKQQLAKAPFECLLNADIEPNPHQVNAFCAAIQALKTGGIILADEVGLGKTIEAGLVLNYILDNGAKKVLISLPATLRKQWEVELLEKFGRQAVILDRYTVEHDLANVQTHLGNADEVSIVIASYDYSSKLIKRFPHVKWDFLIIDEAHNLRNVFHGTKRAKNLYDLTHGIPKILLTATPLQNSLTDLHGLVSFIDPRIFGSEKVFNRRFVDGCDYEELKQELLPVLYRTLRRDVGKYMAFSKRTCITVDFHLSAEEKELYDVTNDFLRRDPLYSIPNANRGLIILVIRKLLASSSFALIETFEVLEKRLEKLYEGTKSAYAQEGFDLFWGFVEDEIDEDGFNEYDDEETAEKKQANNVLIVVFLLCATWILAAIISFISFTAFRWTDKKQGYQLSSFVEKEDASLNFFMTMIIPLLIDDVGTIQGAVTFLIIVVMMCALLSKTHLYYANPVLAILGYRVYEITFKSNPDFNNEICLAVVKGRFLKNPSTVEYKVINDTVLYMKEMNK